MSTSGTILHSTVITGIDNPASQVSKNAWNAPLSVASAAPNGTAMVRDSAQADGWGFEAPQFLQAGSGAVTRTVDARLKDTIHVKDFGAVGDGTLISNGTITVSSTTITAGSAAWASTDVGQLIVIRAAGAAAANLVTTIASYVSSTQITIAAAPSTAVDVGEAIVSWGTNDTAAINAALAAVPVAGGTLNYATGGADVVISRGRYMVTSSLTIRSLTRFKGTGQASIIDASGMTTGNLFTLTNLISGFAYGVQLSHFTAVGPGAASGVNAIATVMTQCEYSYLDCRHFKDAISVGDASSGNSFYSLRIADNQRGVVLGTDSTTSHWYSCYIDQNQQGVVSNGAQTNNFYSCIIESNTRATALGDGNAGVLFKGDKWSNFYGCHLEGNTVDVLLTTNGVRATESAKFDACLFNPPNGAAAHIRIVSAYYTKLTDCNLSSGTTQYIRIWDAGIGTQLDHRIANVTWGYKNEADAIVTTPPGVFTTVIQRGTDGAINVKGAGTYSTYLAVGAVPSGSGIIRIPYLESISAGRAAGDGGDMALLSNGAGDAMQIGEGGFTRIVVNPSQRDMNVQIYSDTRVDMFFADAGALSGAGAVAFGNEAPLSKVGVSGNLAVGTSYGEIAAPASGLIVEGSTGIGTSAPNANAILHLASTTKAFIPPPMTTAQRDAISSPVTGMMVVNITTGKLNIYGASAWEAVTSI